MSTMVAGEKRTKDLDETSQKATIALLDIEGTTTSISFVKDKLFPYIREKLETYVKDHWSDAEFQDDLSLLREQAKKDVTENVDGVVSIPDESEDATQECVVKNVLWQMDLDRKTKALKQLQGHIMRDGYKNGDIKGHVYSDVVPSLRSWTHNGRQLYVYSSGSVEAQKLLFGHSEEGDLLELFSGHFDTEVGPKGDAGSYANIVKKLDCRSEDIVFFTDVPKEAKAAKEAGLHAVLVMRDGNEPLSDDDKVHFPVIRSFKDFVFEVSAKRKKMSNENIQPLLSEPAINGSVCENSASADSDVLKENSNEMESMETDVEMVDVSSHSKPDGNVSSNEKECGLVEEAAAATHKDAALEAEETKLQQKQTTVIHEQTITCKVKEITSKHKEIPSSIKEAISQVKEPPPEEREVASEISEDEVQGTDANSESKKTDSNTTTNMCVGDESKEAELNESPAAKNTDSKEPESKGSDTEDKVHKVPKAGEILDPAPEVIKETVPVEIKSESTALSENVSETSSENTELPETAGSAETKGNKKTDVKPREEAMTEAVSESCVKPHCDKPCVETTVEPKSDELTKTENPTLETVTEDVLKSAVHEESTKVKPNMSDCEENSETPVKSSIPESEKQNSEKAAEPSVEVKQEVESSDVSEPNMEVGTTAVTEVPAAPEAEPETVSSTVTETGKENKSSTTLENESDGCVTTVQEDTPSVTVETKVEEALAEEKAQSSVTSIITEEPPKTEVKEESGCDSITTSEAKKCSNEKANPVANIDSEVKETPDVTSGAESVPEQMEVSEEKLKEACVTMSLEQKEAKVTAESEAMDVEESVTENTNSASNTETSEVVEKKESEIGEKNVDLNKDEAKENGVVENGQGDRVENGDSKEIVNAEVATVATKNGKVEAQEGSEEDTKVVVSVDGSGDAQEAAATT